MKSRKNFVLYGVLLALLLVALVVLWQTKFSASGDNLLANPGFESGLTSWSKAATKAATINTDATRVNGGTKSLMLQTTGLASTTDVFDTVYQFVEYPYASNKAPVKASVWAQTSLTCGGEKQGAYISLSYAKKVVHADKTSEWVLLGDGYQTRGFNGEYATWQRIEAEMSVNPPSDTTYVRVGLHIGTRCDGKVWFDDASLQANNTDVLRALVKHPTYRNTLYLGDKDIYNNPDPLTKNIIVSVSIENPVDSPARHDITAQLIGPDPGTAVLATVNLNRAKVNDTAKQVRLTVNNPAAGDYTVKVTSPGLSDVSIPMTIETGQNPLALSEPNTAGTFFDFANRAIVNRKVFFPLGFYMFGVTSNADHKFEDMAKIAASGFNTVLDYNYAGCNHAKASVIPPTGTIKWGCLAETPPPADGDPKKSLSGVDTFFTAAEQNNLKVVLTLNQFLEGSIKGSFQAAPGSTNLLDGHLGLEAVVNQFKNEPNLLAWYTNDEMSEWYLQQIKTNYDYIKANDPNHPVFQVVTNSQAANNHMASLDVLGIDKYPNFCAKPDGTTDAVCRAVYAASPLQAITTSTQRAKRATMDTKPAWMVLSANSKSGVTDAIDAINTANGKLVPPVAASDAKPIPPTYDQVINMSYQALVNGARGIFFFDSFDVTADSKDASGNVTNSQWRIMSKAGHHLGQISAFALGVDMVGNKSVIARDVNYPNNPSGKVTTLTRRGSDGKYYLMVVNTSETAQADVEYSLPVTNTAGLKSLKDVTPVCTSISAANTGKPEDDLAVACEPKNTAKAFGSTDTVLPLGVRLYEIVK